MVVVEGFERRAMWMVVQYCITLAREIDIEPRGP